MSPSAAPKPPVPRPPPAPGPPSWAAAWSTTPPRAPRGPAGAPPSPGLGRERLAPAVAPATARAVGLLADVAAKVLKHAPCVFVVAPETGSPSLAPAPSWCGTTLSEKQLGATSSRSVSQIRCQKDWTILTKDPGICMIKRCHRPSDGISAIRLTIRCPLATGQRREPYNHPPITWHEYFRVFQKSYPVDPPPAA